MYRLKMIALIFVSVVFFIVGVDLLISAYRLKDPFSFVLMFFASNLMMLISAALGLGFALRLKRSLSAQSKKTSHPPAGKNP